MDGQSLSFRQVAAILVVLLISASVAMADDLRTLFSKGDALDAKNKNSAALVIYLEADKISPNNAEVLRRISKQYSQLMLEAKTVEEKKALAVQSMEAAQRAVTSDPKNSMAHLSVAIATGRAAFLEPPKERIAMSRIIHDEAVIATKLDPSNSVAWHVLGRWNYELANFNAFLKALAQTIYGKFPDATNEKAAECFKKAVELDPSSVANHVEYGRALDAFGKKEEARKELEKGLSLPSTAKDDAATKELAEKTLKSL